MAIAKIVVAGSVCACFALSQIGGCSRANHHDLLVDVGQDELTKRLGGDEVVAILRKPDKATAALLELPDDNDEKTPDRYALASDELSISSEAAARIGHAIADPRKNLQLAAGKGCNPFYEVRFSFSAGQDRVDLYLCFACKALMVYFNGKEVGWTHFDNVHDALIHEALALFPNNAKLVELANR